VYNIYRSCSDYTSAHLVKAMIENGSEACFVKDKKGYLPAHIACSRHCSVDKLHLLLRAHPASLFAKTNDGQTLLALAKATRTKTHPNYQLIAELQRLLQVSAGAEPWLRIPPAAEIVPPCMSTPGGIPVHVAPANVAPATRNAAPANVAPAAMNTPPTTASGCQNMREEDSGSKLTKKHQYVTVIDSSDDATQESRSKKPKRDTQRTESVVVPGTYPIGTSVRNYFPGHGWLRGQIVSATGHTCHVRYEDGDEEHFTCESPELASSIEEARCAREISPPTCDL